MPLINFLVFNMKSTRLQAAIAVATLSAAGLCHAQATESPWYGEIGYTAIEAKESLAGMSAKYEPSLLTGVVGYRFTPNVSLEGMVGFGMGDDEVKLDGVGTGLKGKLGTSFGVFVRPSVQVSDSVELFGRLGFVRSEVKFSAPGFSQTGSDTSLAYGFGANFHLSKSSYLQANWTSYYDDDGVQLQGLGLAWGMKF